MKTLNSIVIKAAPAKIYSAAERIVEWPCFLAHYRWVTVFSEKKGVRQVEMAATRDGIPCKWQSEQRLFPGLFQVYYRHTRSNWTQNMEVWWKIKPLKGGICEVSISHEMPPEPNFLMAWFRQHVVGSFFVENIAAKTLAGLKRHLEQA